MGELLICYLLCLMGSHEPLHLVILLVYLFNSYCYTFYFLVHYSYYSGRLVATMPCLP